jgi:DNA-binding transcriptional regulator YhcF (GntR family)
MKKMEKHNQIQKDFFDTMINDAIEDLSKSGLEDEEIITIISQEFGPRYVHHLFKVAKQAGARET